MAATGKLKALQVAKLHKPGMYADGGGLYLQVTANAQDGEPAKSWIYRYMLRGKAREMGLGSLNTISLQQARDKALDCRRLRQERIDPIEARNAARAQGALEAAKSITFKQAATEYVRSHRAGWRNAKHAAQWSATLATYAEPKIGALSVQAIDTGLVLKVLEPIWTAKPETASRLRGRIEAILDWAKVRGYRVGENPARWRGHLDKLLPARNKVRRVEHHAALPYPAMPEFMISLRAQQGAAARALEFAILTAARTGEVIGARWDEIDLAGKVWIIPAGRMKAGKEHRVALSDRALALLGDARALIGLDAMAGAQSPFIFGGGRSGRPLSNMALLMLLRRMGHGDLTAHGFRSTFRDWAAECTNFPSEVVEMALAHAVGDKVEAAYRRGNLLVKRFALMSAWAEYCASGPRAESGNVTAFPRGPSHANTTHA
jgi:integrase